MQIYVWDENLVFVLCQCCTVDHLIERQFFSGDFAGLEPALYYYWPPLETPVNLSTIP